MKEPAVKEAAFPAKDVPKEILDALEELIKSEPVIVAGPEVRFGAEMEDGNRRARQATTVPLRFRANEFLLSREGHIWMTNNWLANKKAGNPVSVIRINGKKVMLRRDTRFCSDTTWYIAIG